MKYTAHELAARISAGGRKGAAQTALIRQDKRRRYLAGVMDEAELAEYELYLAQRRSAGAKGGANAAAARRRARSVSEVAPNG